MLGVAVAVCGTAVVGVAATSPLGIDSSASGSAAPPVATPAPKTQPVRTLSALVAARRRTVVRVLPSLQGEVVSVVRRGILLPVTAERNGFLRVLTPCELDGWVNRRDVLFRRRGVQRPALLRDATIVVDPGHGGIDPGAVGKGGLFEKTANLEIARRLQTLLRPARVVMTREADYTVALRYRTELATAARAHAFVSVHNNSSPDGPSEHPGTETYYQRRSPASKRLAGLTYEELLRTLGRLRISWVSQDDAGAKYRMNERGIDYYFVLRHSKVPAVIVEGLYISNPPEEALLRREDVKDVMATALAKAINRYFTTRDPGSGFITRPSQRVSGPRSRTPAACRDPA